MLHATEVLGAQTYDAKGNFVGRVKEMFIEPAEQPNRVARLMLSRGKYSTLVARHDQVASVMPGTIRLTVDERTLDAYQPNDAWLAVRKDLLDQQIIDTSGRKVVRVNDIDLAEHKTNGNVELRIAHVDVGLPGAIRRLLQGVVSPSAIRALQAKLPPRTIVWEFVNLIEPDPMRRVKLRITHEKLEHMHPADLADIMEELSPAERQAIVGSLDEETAAEALAEIDQRLQSQIMEKMDPEKAAGILEEMEPDQAADLLDDLSVEKTQQVLAEMSGEDAREVRELLKFDENSAGGMMTTELVIVGEDATREEVVRWIRQNDVNRDQLDTVFLVNTGMRLCGAVSVARMWLAEDRQRLAELRMEPIVSVQPGADDREVFELFDKYNLRSLAVVNAENNPIGMITVDDVVTRLRAKA